MNTKLTELIFDKWIECLEALRIARMALCAAINVNAVRAEVEKWKDIIDRLIHSRDSLEEYIWQSV